MNAFNWDKYSTGGAKRPDSFTGMQDPFRAALENMFSNAPEGVREQLQVGSGFRSTDRQQELWDEALFKYGSAAEARKWVAPPGRSQHGFGNAADLKYLDPAARAWAHENAGEYGMSFPLGNEPWHIELEGARGQQKGVMDDPLREFAGDMKNASRAIVGDAKGSLPRGQDPEQKMPYEFSPEIFGANPTKMDMGTPAVGAPNTPSPYQIGRPITAPNVTPNTVPNEVQPRLSTRGGDPNSNLGTPVAPGTPNVATTGDDKDKKPGLSDRIASTLFPKAENPKKKLGNILQALSTGLGQMSQGQPVDMSKLFNRMAVERQSVSSNAQAARDSQFKREMQRGNLQVARSNAAVAQQRLAHDIGQDGLEGGTAALPFSPETIEKYSTSPAAQPFIEMMANGDKEQRKIGAQGFKEFLLDTAVDEADNPAALSNLYTAMNGGDPEQIANVLAAENISSEDFKRVADIVKPPAPAQLGKILSDPAVPDSLKDAIRDTMRIQGGVGQDQVAEANFKEGRAYQDTLMQTLASSSGMNMALTSFMDKSVEAQRDGDDTSGVTSKYLAAALASTKRYLPSNWQQSLEETIGMSPEVFRELDSLGQYIVLVATKPLMEGGGSITENERKQIAMSMAGADDAFEPRMSIIQRLTTLGEVDELSLRYYNDNKGGDAHSNYETARSNLTLAVGSAMPALYASNEAWFAFQNQDLSDSYSAEFEGLTNYEKYLKLAPVLSTDDAKVVLPIVNESIWVRKRDGQLMRGNEPFTKGN